METFTTPKGTVLPLLNLKGKVYLQVAHRIQWFREEHPDWTIETEIIERTQDQTLAKAKIIDADERLISDGYKQETKADFRDHTEKALTGAVGRALALCGYGTQFAVDLDEGNRIVDAPQSNMRSELLSKIWTELKNPAKASEEPMTDAEAQAYIFENTGIKSSKDLTIDHLLKLEKLLFKTSQNKVL